MVPCSFFLTINSIFTSNNQRITSTYKFALSFISNKMSQNTNDDQLTLYFTSLSYSSSAHTIIEKPYRFPSSREFINIQIIR
jgi:hypothetical protein